MALILIVDDMPIFREPIEAILRAQGFSTLAACNGQEAIASLSTARPDLVVLDLDMPVVNGLGVLAYMRQHTSFKAIPVIILTAESDKGHIVEAVKLGISGYVLKTSFSLKDLLQRVQAHLPPAPSGKPATPVVPAATPSIASANVTAAPAHAHRGPIPAAAVMAPGSPGTAPIDIKSLKPILSRADLLERLKSREELKGLSPTISQVLALTASPNCSVESVSKAVRQDQALALKILKVANSAAYSRGDRVDNVHKAILRIGMENIRQTVLNIGVVERFSSPAFQQHLSTPMFWEHSIACGLIAAEIARAQGAKEVDSAFTSGLLHDLGRVIFAEVLGDQYIRVIETAQALAAPLELVESRMLLLNHADVMDRLLSAWQFPKHLVDPIMFHHLSAGNVRSVAPTRVPEILRMGLANRLAHAMLLGSSGNEMIYPTEEHCRALDISAATIRSIEESARKQTDETKFALLSGTSSTAWPRRAEQWRSTISGPLRALFISADPEIDAYRVFCQELSDPLGQGPPNLAVVHIAAAKERALLADRLGAAEQAAGVRSLPILVLSPAGQITLDDSALAGRACRALGTPTHVSQFIAAVNALITDGSLRAAA